MKKILLLSLIATTLLSACGTSEVTKNINNNSLTVTGSQSWATGGWEKASIEASQKASDYCAKNNQDYIFINEQRTGVPGFSLLTSAISFTCGQNSKALFSSLTDECFDKMQITDLDVIRNKVELFKKDGSSPPPFDIASNTNYPTANEKEAIAKWAKIREECNAKNMQIFKDSLQSNNPMQATFNQKQIEFRNQSASLVSSLVVALYQGKLPYGEFAQKRHEGFMAVLSAERDFRSATLIQDRNAQMQAQDLALKQQQNNINAWNGYMNSVNARQPVTQPAPYFIPPVKSPTVTNCNKFGNNINCVTN
jgi:hypothetical protein